MKSLSIIIPILNEEQIIERFYDELKKVVSKSLANYHVTMLFVVDRCTDRTMEILERIAAQDRQVQVLGLSARFGHQMALLAGIDHSDSDVLIMMDGDLQHPPELIPALLAKYEEGFDIVHTIRISPPGWHRFRRFASNLFYHVVNQLSEIPIHKNAADFRLISARVANIFKYQIRERNQFLRGLFVWVGFESTWVPFQSREREAGTTKYGVVRLFQFAGHGLVSFSKRPLQVAIVLGMVFSLLGLVLAFGTFLQYLVYSSLPSGWTTLAILIPFFSGLQLLFMGILGEYVGAIFDEVKGRPHYIVQKKINFS
jgi:glycosyltransferase involved in cell wall biosynthesis